MENQSISFKLYFQKSLFNIFQLYQIIIFGIILILVSLTRLNFLNKLLFWVITILAKLCHLEFTYGGFPIFDNPFKNPGKGVDGHSETVNWIKYPVNNVIILSNRRRRADDVSDSPKRTG